jgi:hypothetical protein
MWVPGHWNDSDYVLDGAVGDAFKMGSDADTIANFSHAHEQYSYMSM